jgi:hypothetical protein
MNPAPNIHATARGRFADDLADDLAEDLAEDLARALGLVEDWLLHASDETLDELADFAYGHHGGHDQLRWIIELLGEAAVWLRPPPPSTAGEPATTQPRTSR